MVNSKHRLVADNPLDKKIQEKQKQIKQLKQSLPSRNNKMSVSPTQHINTDRQINNIKNQILDLRQKKVTTVKGETMYSFLLSKVFEEDRYEFFTYTGRSPVTVEFRGKPIEIKKGTRFGVRPSSNGKHIRLIFPNDKTRVLTISLETAQELAKRSAP